MALLNCRTSTPGISSGSGSSPMQSQLLFCRLALSSLSVNFITVTQIISGDEYKLKIGNILLCWEVVVQLGSGNGFARLPRFARNDNRERARNDKRERARNDTPPCRCEAQQCRSNLGDGQEIAALRSQ
jgi:hypothetical protein